MRRNLLERVRIPKKCHPRCKYNLLFHIIGYLLLLAPTIPGNCMYKWMPIKKCISQPNWKTSRPPQIERIPHSTLLGSWSTMCGAPADWNIWSKSKWKIAWFNYILYVWSAIIQPFYTGLEKELFVGFLYYWRRYIQTFRSVILSTIVYLWFKSF